MSVEQAGVVGYSQQFVGVWADARGQQPALFAKGATLAGRFEGDLEVTGDIRLLNADCAEDFDVLSGEQAEPGTVMVVGEAGSLVPSQQAYDRRVAGVISGAGDYKPGIVLDFCKVDASYGAIEIGDLLTTSDTPGHAMKAHNPREAFGAVIGKALRPLHEGQDMIPILIALQ
jgi:hypothetical protein